MGWILMLLAAILFFFAGVGATVIPNPVTWGLFAMALAFLVGGTGVPWTFTRSQ